MDFLRVNDPPADLHDPVMLFAFAGWADASESATHALRYLVRHLQAVKFADVDPEEFYNFTRVRPYSKFDDEGSRFIEWPANEFYAVKRGDEGEDLVLLVGVEPNLRWRTFCDGMVSMVKELGVKRAVQVGALLDAVPHTRDIRVTGTATSRELRSMLKGIELRRSRYTGPTGIAGVLSDAMTREGIPVVSLWGHAPHYLQVSPNPKVSLRLVHGIERLVNIEVDVKPLESQGVNFERRVERALSGEPEVNAYVARLESQWDSLRGGGAPDNTPTATADDDDGEMPDPAQAIRSIEEFLKQARDDELSPENDAD